MKTDSFSAAQVIATVAACIGKRLGFETLKEILLSHGVTGLQAFIEACRVEFVARGNVNAKRASLAYMQKDSVPGVSTFYTYSQKVLKLGQRIDAGDPKAMNELMALTAAKCVNSKPRGKSGAPMGNKTETQVKPLTVADCIAFLSAAHAAGALTAPEYAALADLIPAQHPMRNMGQVIEASPMLAH